MRGASRDCLRRSREGEEDRPFFSDVTKYADYLKGKHDQALSHVGGGQKLYDYVQPERLRGEAKRGPGHEA